MTDVNIFEQAVRMKLRVNTGSKLVSVEDLWDIPVQSTRGDSLDKAWRNINIEMKEYGEESFISEKRVPASLTLSKAVIEHIITVKQAEAAERKAATQKAELKKLIKAKIAEKQSEELLSGSAEELQAKLDALGD